eukprot:TRINITY_DN4562_c0_g2_i2.p1 TRINITY_DN4562_c0_g2~~TRINITY_DN4562_c0_g2_i2.p1  ORF type:complete len:1266 (-),score=87.68 TRINITY_DN4562_c0_g2_i2:220-4017(-)
MMIRGAPPIGVASIYISPSVQGIDIPKLLDIMEAAGVDIILSDMNARHPMWCPALDVNYKHHVNKAATERGDALTGSPSWAVVNTRVATRHVSGTSPDTIIVRSPQVDGHFQQHPLWARNRAICQQGSDHIPLLFTVTDPERPNKWSASRCRRISYKKVDWDRAREILTSSLPHMHSRRSAASQYYAYERALRTTLSSMPQSGRRRKPKPMKPPEEVRLLEDEISELYSKDNFSAELRDKVREYRDKLGSWRQALEEQRMDNYHKPTKTLWEEVKPPVVRTPPCLVGANGVPLPAPHIAQRFAKAFAAKHKAGTNANAPAPQTSQTQELPELRVTVGEVMAAIKGLNTKQASDPQGIKPEFLRQISRGTGRYLAKMFTAMLRDGFVPITWRRADVIPIYKEKNKPLTETDSYRPVSISELHCKLLETIVATRIHHHLRKNPLNPRQFGFRKGHSLDMPLMHLVSSLRESSGFYAQWEGRKGAKLHYSAVVVAVDFTDAFCRLLQSHIEKAMRKKGIPEYLIAWTMAFLDAREIRVFCNGFFSRRYPTDVGCPQGSILGPLLWALGMEDLMEELDKYRIATKEGTSKDLNNTLSEDRNKIVPVLYKARQAQKPPHWPPQKDKFGKDQPPALSDDVAFADDLTLWAVAVSPHEAVAYAQVMLNIVGVWADKAHIKISTKTEARWASFNTTPSSLMPVMPVPLKIGADVIIYIPPILTGATPPPIRILGLLLDCRLNFENHVEMIENKVMAAIDAFPRLLPPTARAAVLKAWTMPVISALLPVFGSSMSITAKANLNKILARVARYIIGAIPTADARACLLEAGLYDLEHLTQVTTISLARRIWRLPPSYSYLLVPWKTAGAHHRHFDALTSAYTLAPRKDIPIPPGGHQRALSNTIGDISTEELAHAMNNVKFHTSLTFEGQQLQKKKHAHLCLAFNEKQLSIGLHPKRIDLWTDGSVVHSGGDPLVDEEDRDTNITSGGAWFTVAYPQKPEAPLTSGEISLGGFACSYSVEREALRAGIESLLSAARSLKPKAVRIVTDSLSCLQELQKGPHKQTEEAMEDIWASLAKFRCEIHMIFIFSHMENTGDKEEGAQFLPSQEEIEEQMAPDGPMRWAIEVDNRAQAAVSESASCGFWPNDQLRPRLKAARLAAKKRFTEKPPTRVQLLGPKASKELHTGIGLPRRGQVLLFQLRTGACPTLGGWKHEEPTPCRHCGQLTGRRTWANETGGLVATDHLFECPNFPTTLNSNAPWEYPKEAVAHLKAFLGN